MAVLMRHPIMIVRARLDPTVLETFEEWHRRTHLPHVLEIPGIVSAFRVRGSDAIAGAHLMGYTFEDESVVQTALSSEQAQVARRDWDTWADQVYEQWRSTPRSPHYPSSSTTTSAQALSDQFLSQAL